MPKLNVPDFTESGVIISREHRPDLRVTESGRTRPLPGQPQDFSGFSKQLQCGPPPCGQPSSATGSNWVPCDTLSFHLKAP